MNLIIALLALLKQHREIHGITWKIPVLSSFITGVSSNDLKEKDWIDQPIVLAPTTRLQLFKRWIALSTG